MEKLFAWTSKIGNEVGALEYNDENIARFHFHRAWARDKRARTDIFTVEYLLLQVRADQISRSLVKLYDRLQP